MSDTAVAFDLDGTLVHLDIDIEAVRAAVVALFADDGEPAEMRPIQAGIDRAATAVAHGDPLRQRELRARARAIIDRAELAAAGCAPIANGVQWLLSELAGSGVRLGVVTDNGRACASVCLARLRAMGGLWVEAAVVTRDDVDQGKPAPQGLARSARALLPAGGRLWYVGDHVRDIETARAADAELAGIQVRAVGVTGGHSARASLAAAHPDHLLDQLGELVDLVHPPASRR
jgi:phosphoglycolate phosphatase